MSDLSPNENWKRVKWAILGVLKIEWEWNERFRAFSKMNGAETDDLTLPSWWSAWPSCGRRNWTMRRWPYTASASIMNQLRRFSMITLISQTVNRWVNTSRQLAGEPSNGSPASQRMCFRYKIPFVSHFENFAGKFWDFIWWFWEFCLPLHVQKWNVSQLYNRGIWRISKESLVIFI